MLAPCDSKSRLLVRLTVYVAAAGMALLLAWANPAPRAALGQTEPAAAEAAGPSGDPVPSIATESATGKNPAATVPPRQKSINILALALAGGIFMVPIAAMSILAVTMTIERLLVIRRQRVLPEGLVEGLGELAAGGGNFDPRKAYRICQEYPSAAAHVVRVMLLRAGRPLPEVESAVAQTSQREADKLYANVRWLNLAASLSTMLGLIGTIQGMIIAFHRLTIMDAAADRTSVLADGIYTALVTTFAGLAVAIPALLASHYFEGRILAFFRQIDELVFNLLPQLERYEGRVRFGRQSEPGENVAGEEPARVEAELT